MSEKGEYEYGGEEHDHEAGESVHEVSEQKSEKNLLNELREISRDEYLNKSAEIGNNILDLAKEGKLRILKRTPRPNTPEAVMLERTKQRLGDINAQGYRFENDGTGRVYFPIHDTGRARTDYIRLRPECEESDEDKFLHADDYGGGSNMGYHITMSPYLDLEIRSIYNNVTPKDEEFIRMMAVKASADSAVRKYKEMKQISDEIGIDLENPEIFKND